MILAPLLLWLAAALAEAEKALESKDPEGAIRIFREYLAEHPDDAGALLGLAQSLDRARRRSEALEAYDRLLALKPGDPAAVTGRARVLGREHRYAEALKDLQALAAARPDDPQAWWALGDLNLWSGRPEPAVEAYSKALALAPDATGARIGRGRAYARGRKYSEGMADLLDVLAAHPRLADAWWALGDIHFWAGRAHDAVEAYSKALLIDPSDTALRISRARAYARGKQFEQAREDLGIVTAAAPKDPEGWWALGDVELWAGHFKSAVEAYTRSLDLAPDDPDPRIGRARALARDDRFADAKADLKLVLDRHADYMDAWWALGDVRLWAGEADGAVEAYSKALDLAPHETGPKVGRARARARGRRFDKAVEDLEEILGRHPEETEAWRTLGDVRLWMGDPKEAEKAYDRLIRLSPDEPESYVSRARALQAQAKTDAARRDLQAAKALAWDPSEIDRLEKDLGRPALHALPWEVLVRYETMSFSHDRSDWTTWTERFQRSFARGSLALEAIQSRRFDLDDEAWALDAYAPLWDRAYLNVRYQMDSTPDFFPRADYLIEPFQGFGKGWEGSVFYRHMDFDTAQVDLYGGSMAFYPGPWCLRYRLTLVPSLGTLEDSHSFLVRRYFGGSDSYLQAEAGEGNSKVEVAPQDVQGRTSHSLSVGGHMVLTQNLGLAAAFHYQDDEELPVGKGFTLELVARW